MQEADKALQDYINNGEYFADAKAWYKQKYIYPFSQRSFVVILTVIIFIVFIGLLINIYSLLPAVTQIKYSINADSSANKSAQITRANHIKADPLASIVDILIRNYVIKRESYDYDQLKKQFIFVKNNSTRIIFRSFNNYMNIDNPSSPVMRYQKNVKRKIDILSTKQIDKGKILVEFHSQAVSGAREILEDMIWQTIIEFEVDDIHLNLPSGARFNFTVIDYKSKLLKDKKAIKS